MIEQTRRFLHRRGRPKATVVLLGLAVLAWPAAALAQGPPDHARFTLLLQEVVVDSLVDYQALLEHGGLLDGYIAELSRTRPDRLEAASRDDQLAFWLNAYNACMLLRVRDHYPIEPGGTGLFGAVRNWATDRPANSVWQIKDVFTEAFCPVVGHPRSLDEIEHEIIRPRFGEPRIHFAVNCAAFSCPRLADEAYMGERLDAQLDRQVHAFIQDRRHFQVEQGPPVVLRLNRVLDWYSEDFGGTAALPDFFLPYLEGRRQELLARDDVRVLFFDYDWTLNDVHAEHEGADR
ncbi:MAG: DUF547 domain-containing protein [Gemmatimonadota bacterium]